MVLIKLLPILGTIYGTTVKLMVLALICLGNNRHDLLPPYCIYSRHLHSFPTRRSSDLISSNNALPIIWECGDRSTTAAKKASPSDFVNVDFLPSKQIYSAHRRRTPRTRRT